MNLHFVLRKQTTTGSAQADSRWSHQLSNGDCGSNIQGYCWTL